MKPTRTLFKALVTIGFLGVSQTSKANLITNGSFETGTFVSNSQAAMSLSTGSTAMTGWSVINDSLAWIGPSNPWGLTASRDDFFLDLTGYSFGAPFGGIAQTISTIAGQTYELSFDLGSSNSYGRPNAILASAGLTSAIFTGALTGSNNEWQHFILPFTANSANMIISFTGYTGQSYIGLDNVAVNAAATSVPEPATLAMLVTGLGLLGFIARHKRVA